MHTLYYDTTMLFWNNVVFTSSCCPSLQLIEFAQRLIQLSLFSWTRSSAAEPRCSRTDEKTKHWRVQRFYHGSGRVKSMRGQKTSQRSAPKYWLFKTWLGNQLVQALRGIVDEGLEGLADFVTFLVAHFMCSWMCDAWDGVCVVCTCVVCVCL